jgi:phosphomannomutase
MGKLDAIFKAYDVRGRADTGDIDEDAAERIGAGFASFVKAETVAVGRDCRVSSPAIASAFMRGVTSQGVNVVDLGEVATDVIYYYSGLKNMPGAVVTASHNPAEYNGIKMCHRSAAPIGTETGLDDIKAFAHGFVPGTVSESVGSISEFDPELGYVDHVLSVIDPAKIGPLRVAADGGNGMAGMVVSQVFDRLDAKLLGLYLEPDGTFPNHPADPLNAENLVDLIEFVAIEGADVGVAFDGDADRAFFVDETGKPVSGSTTTAIIADWFLKREPGSKIVHNLICSKAVAETIVAGGGVPVRTKVGHSYIKQVMAETGAVFGGEHSGHYYFSENYRADSGMLATLVLLQVLSESGMTLSALRTQYEPYVASGEINNRVEDVGAATDAVAAEFADAKQDRLDGLTVDLGDRWFNLRPSNTEPLLRLNVEAPDQDGVDVLIAEVTAIITR